MVCNREDYNSVFLEIIKSYDINVDLSKLRLGLIKKEMSIDEYIKFLIYFNYRKTKGEDLDILDSCICEGICRNIVVNDLGLDSPSNTFKAVLGDILVHTLGFEKTLEFTLTNSKVFNKKIRSVKSDGCSLYDTLGENLQLYGNVSCLENIPDSLINVCGKIEDSSSSLCLNKGKKVYEKERQN